MAHRIVDPETGFIEYKRTPEENDLVKVKEDNEKLKREVEELKALLTKKEG